VEPGDERSIRLYSPATLAYERPGPETKRRCSRSSTTATLYGARRKPARACSRSPTTASRVAKRFFLIRSAARSQARRSRWRRCVRAHRGLSIGSVPSSRASPATMRATWGPRPSAIEGPSRPKVIRPRREARRHGRQAHRGGGGYRVGKQPSRIAREGISRSFRAQTGRGGSRKEGTAARAVGRRGRNRVRHDPEGRSERRERARAPTSAATRRTAGAARGG